MSQSERGQAPEYDPDRYDTVESRIERFYEEHPDGRIDTSLLSDPNDVSQCLFLAAVYLHKDDAGHVLQVTPSSRSVPRKGKQARYMP